MGSSFHVVWHVVLVLVIAAILVLLPATSLGQTHLWSRHYGGVNNDEGRGIATDGAGHVIVAGWFEGTADFGGGPLVSAGLRDVFVAKYDPMGNHIWSRAFGDIGYDEAWDVAVDGLGNVVVTGLFNGTVDFGGGPLISAGEDDIFVAKFDGDGGHVWSRRFGGTGDDVGFGITVDLLDHVILTGFYENTVDFGGGPLSSAGFADIFVARYDPVGHHMWSRGFGDTNTDVGNGIAVDASGNIVVTGYFQGTVDFGGGPLVSSAGYVDIFLAKYSAVGIHIWSRRFGDSGFDGGEAVAVDAAGNVVVTGNFSGTVDFGGGPLSSAGSGDIFVARFDPFANHMWSRRAGDTSGDAGFNIVMESVGDVWVTGFFQGTVDFGGGPRVSAGSWEIFVVKYDAAGNHIWSERFGDTLHDAGYGIAVDKIDDVLLAGYIRGTVDFGGGGLTSAGGDDVFVTKFGSGRTCGPSLLLPVEIHSVWYSFPLWEIQVALRNGGSRPAMAVAAEMAQGPPWLSIPDPNCYYGDIPVGGGSLGGGDTYLLDLTGWQGGSFPVVLDLWYEDVCDNRYFVRLEPELIPPGPTGIGDVTSDRLMLWQNNPNPFNPTTRIAFALSQDGHATLSIYDVTGRHVATLADRWMTAGAYVEEWDGRDMSGEDVSSGVYLYRLEVGNDVQMRKAVLLR